MKTQLDIQDSIESKFRVFALLLRGSVIAERAARTSRLTFSETLCCPVYTQYCLFMLCRYAKTIWRMQCAVCSKKLCLLCSIFVPKISGGICMEVLSVQRISVCPAASAPFCIPFAHPACRPIYRVGGCADTNQESKFDMRR